MDGCTARATPFLPRIPLQTSTRRILPSVLPARAMLTNYGRQYNPSFLGAPASSAVLSLPNQWCKSRWYFEAITDFFLCQYLFLNFGIFFSPAHVTRLRDCMNHRMRRATSCRWESILWRCRLPLRSREAAAGRRDLMQRRDRQTAAFSIRVLRLLCRFRISAGQNRSLPVTPGHSVRFFRLSLWPR